MKRNLIDCSEGKQCTGLFLVRLNQFAIIKGGIPVAGKPPRQRRQSYAKISSNFTPGSTACPDQTDSLSCKFFLKGHALRHKNFLSNHENLPTFPKQV